MDLDRFLQELDELLRLGKPSQVAARVSELNFAQVPRKTRVTLAKICRRAGAISHGLRLLQPIVRGENLGEAPATPAEICEYAVLLSRVGSIDEALALFSNVQLNQFHEAYLLRAFCHISSWNYDLAAEDLQMFLKGATDPYQRLIAHVNLAAAEIARRNYTRAITLIDQNIANAEEQKSWRLLGNSYELRAQANLWLGDWQGFHKDLAKADQILKDNQTYDTLLIQKWRAVAASLEKQTPFDIQQFRRKAGQAKHWESVRESDFFLLKVRFQSALFDHLVIGTPWAGYRARAIQEFGREPSPTLTIGSGHRQLDLTSDRITEKIHQCISALTADLYAPRNVGSLFSRIYAGEHFDVHSSPLRIRQIIKRSRQWLEENEYAATIVQDKGSYRFKIEGDLRITMATTDEMVSAESVLWRKLTANSLEFTVNEASTILGISRSGVHRLTRWAEQNGKLVRSGVGKATRYKSVA